MTWEELIAQMEQVAAEASRYLESTERNEEGD